MLVPARFQASLLAWHRIDGGRIVLMASASERAGFGAESMLRGAARKLLSTAVGKGSPEGFLHVAGFIQGRASGAPSAAGRLPERRESAPTGSERIAGRAQGSTPAAGVASPHLPG